MPSYTLKKSNYYCKTFRSHQLYSGQNYLGYIVTVKKSRRVYFKPFAPFEIGYNEEYPFYSLLGAIKFLEAAKKIQENMTVRN